MPSAFTHIFVGEALGKTYAVRPMPVRFWVLAAVCSIAPDIDVIGYYCGVKYNGMFGHRGFFHSLLFALLAGALVVSFAFRTVPRFSRQWRGLFFFFFIVTAAHGFLDSLTDKGMGVGFFIPFLDTRFHMPWRPIPASPMSVERFFGAGGLAVLAAEIVRVWLPVTALCAAAVLIRKRAKRD
jgi:inner membrane protein